MGTNNSEERTKTLFDFRNRIIRIFEKSDWTDLGIITSCSDIIEKDARLLRSLGWGDDDYPERARIVIFKILERDGQNEGRIEKFVRDKELDPLSSSNFSEYEKVINSNLKKSELFKIPDSSIKMNQVAVMMPFSANLNPVIDKIRSVCKNHELTCLRADDIWENQTIIQDVFDLIYCSHIIIADFTGKNPNVFYEVGIAHTLGKLVIPLTQSISDVPFDLNHHRVLHYHPNSEGIEKMGSELETRIKSVLNKR